MPADTTCALPRSALSACIGETGRASPSFPAAKSAIFVAMPIFRSLRSGAITLLMTSCLLGASGDLRAQQADTVRPAEPVSTERQERDEAVRAELQSIFDRVPVLDEVEVAVSAGVVRLSGEVRDRAAAERAIELAGQQDGVVYVDDEPLVTMMAEARLEDIGGRLQEQIDAFVDLLPLLGAGLVLAALFGVLAWLVGRVRTTRLFPRMNPFLGAMIMRLAQFVLVILGLILALELLDATALVGAVVGTAGLAGLALGFAFKDIAENYLAGVILSVRQPFSKNDLIVVGGHEGKVVRLTGRETILMTLEGNHVQIPNATVFREPMINYSRNPLRRFTLDVDVAAETDLSPALDAGLVVLEKLKGVIDDPKPTGLVVGYGNGTMALRFFGWVDQRLADFALVRSEAVRLLKEGLEGSGVDLPSPEYRLTMTEADAGERPRRQPDRQRVAEVVDAAPQRDVSVDRTVDEQIEQERQADQQDLLE